MAVSEGGEGKGENTGNRGSQPIFRTASVAAFDAAAE